MAKTFRFGMKKYHLHITSYSLINAGCNCFAWVSLHCFRASYYIIVFWSPVFFRRATLLGLTFQCCGKNTDIVKLLVILIQKISFSDILMCDLNLLTFTYHAELNIYSMLSLYSLFTQNHRHNIGYNTDLNLYWIKGALALFVLVSGYVC